MVLAVTHHSSFHRAPSQHVWDFSMKSSPFGRHQRDWRPSGCPPAYLCRSLKQFHGIVIRRTVDTNWLACGSLPFWLSSYQETHRSQCCRCHLCRCRQSFDRWSDSWLRSPKTAWLLSTPWGRSFPNHLCRRDWKLHEFPQFLLRLSPVFRMTSLISFPFASNSLLTICEKT